MANYIKVTLPVAIGIGHTDRPRTLDGGVLLWQTDILRVPEFGIEAKAKRIGGTILTPIEAKREMDGTCKTYAPFHTPDEYKKFEPVPSGSATEESSNESESDRKENE